MNTKTILESKEDNVGFENRLADRMLDEIINNNDIKNVLFSIAATFSEKIMSRIKTVLFDPKVKSITDLPVSYQNTIKILAEKHSKPEKFFGAALPQLDGKQITSTIKNIRLLFSTLEHNLLNIKNVKTQHELLQFFKSLTELGWCYYELLNDLHETEFEKLKNMLWPTPEEFDARVRWDEVGAKKIALTYGIRKDEGVDLLSAEKGVGVTSGKAVFFKLDMKSRFELLVKHYDRALDRRENKEINETDYNKLRDKMRYYKIPLDPSSRQDIAYYAERFKTSFQKLVGNLPLVASVSGSSARAIIALQDSRCFDTNQSFDLDKAQIFSDCFMAFYVRCGHHSLSEVAEVYNRLLDYVAIELPSQLPSRMQISNCYDKSYMVDPDVMERKLPYYVYGDYASFFHVSYRDAIMEDIVHRSKSDFKKSCTM